MVNPERIVDRLCDATNRHDLDALTTCFAVGYRNETPTHPARSFVGRAQVRRNWEQLFAAMPDLSATITRSAVAGDAVWTEWEMRGTRPDGQPHLMRGVIVFGIEDDEIAEARFYLEPVDADPSDVNAEIARVVQSGDAP